MHFILFWYPLFQLIIKFYVCSLYNANEAHKIEEISLLFFVYNFEYYSWFILCGLNPKLENLQKSIKSAKFKHRILYFSRNLSIHVI
jgi:hypothetical protein